MSDDRTVYESHVHLRYVHIERERERHGCRPPWVFNHRPKMHRTSLAYISGRHLLIWPISLVNFGQPISNPQQPPVPRRGSDSRTYQMVSSGEEDINRHLPSFSAHFDDEKMHGKSKNISAIQMISQGILVESCLLL